ncbi:MAG: hypothetical protein NZL95_09365 [Chitinophagales bacterium]|nr:hypothetical protein [Chitinophagales bacterium]MDW8428742.1 hypothetical protein [Chitinophagales bacterium]
MMGRLEWQNWILLSERQRAKLIRRTRRRLNRWRKKQVQLVKARLRRKTQPKDNTLIWVKA